MAPPDHAPPPAARWALYPGSFDPVTLGHEDLIRRAAGLFDRLWVGVLDNPGKTPLFTVEERVGLLREVITGVPGVEVVSFTGLTVDLAARLGTGWIVRGVRSGSDTEYEITMARTNRLCGSRSIETVLLPAAPEVSFITSTLVREVARGGGELGAFVSPAVAVALERKAQGG